MLDHNIKVDGFGKFGSCSFADFASELRAGECRLLLDATKHKHMVRAVDYVVLKIQVKAPDGKTRVIVDLAEGLSDGRTYRGPALPQDRKLSHENSKQAALRLAIKMLGASSIKFDGNVDSFEELVDNPKYPGLSTVYRKEMVVAQVLATDPALNCIGLPKCDNFAIAGRSFAWMTEEQCRQKNVKINQPARSDFSALVFPPVGLDEEELNEFLKKNDVDTSKWGEGTFKSVEDLTEELTKGESALVKNERDGRIHRVVDIVLLQLTREDTGDILIEASEKYKESAQKLDRLPAVKRRADEHQFISVRRMVTKYMQMPDNAVTVDSTDVRMVEEEQESKAFFGLNTVYRKRFMKGILHC